MHAEAWQQQVRCLFGSLFAGVAAKIDGESSIVAADDAAGDGRLGQFGQRLVDFKADNVRAVGTNTLIDADFTNADRGVYYYEVFPVDAATNAGPVAAATVATVGAITAVVGGPLFLVLLRRHHGKGLIR